MQAPLSSTVDPSMVKHLCGDCLDKTSATGEVRHDNRWLESLKLVSSSELWELRQNNPALTNSASKGPCFSVKFMNTGPALQGLAGRVLFQHMRKVCRARPSPGCRASTSFSVRESVRPRKVTPFLLRATRKVYGVKPHDKFLLRQHGSYPSRVPSQSESFNNFSISSCQEGGGGGGGGGIIAEPPFSLSHCALPLSYKPLYVYNCSIHHMLACIHLTHLEAVQDQCLNAQPPKPQACDTSLPPFEQALRS